MSFIPLPDSDPDIIRRQREIAGALARLAPGCVFIEDEEGRRVYSSDAYASCAQIPLLVILPATTKEVSTLLSWCQHENINVIARGAGTNLVGGATPTTDSVIIGLSRMRRIVDINFENGTARVECGITNQALNEALGTKQFFYAPDPASRISCTIGGNIAMNAGGAHGLKYGNTGQNLLGLTMVLMSGEIVEFGGDFMDAGGYDLAALVVGSEGQLGLVTEATLRIRRRPELARPMLIGFTTVKEASDCVSAIFASGMIPSALELLEKRAIHICEQRSPAGFPLDVEAMLIVEAEGSEKEIGLQLEHVREIAGKFNAHSMRTSQNDEESGKIWQSHQALFGAMGKISGYFCIDGVIPGSRIADMLGWIDHFCRHYGFQAATGFHAGDGTLYCFISHDANNEEDVLRAHECKAELLRTCVNAGGSLSGHFGIGLEKRELMRNQFSELDLIQQTRIKTVFDPSWLLNPAKLFPLDAPGRGGIEAELADLTSPGGQTGADDPNSATGQSETGAEELS